MRFSPALGSRRLRNPRPPRSVGWAWETVESTRSPTMARNVPEKIKTKGGHRPRARVHAGWSPIGQRLRRNALLRGLGVFVAVVLVVGFAVDAYAQSFFDSLPSIQGLDSAAFAGDTLITDRNGIVLADVGNHGDHRLAVKLKNVSPVAIQATVAIEDKGFYSNPGFDIQGIIRAILDDLRAGHIVAGGSTITQQLAKQQFLTPAQSYFHIPAAKLDLAQAAVLAGLPQAPTEWNPVLHPDAARLRQTEVLQAMVRQNYITQDQMDAALAEKLNYQAPINSFLAPHFVDFVLEELRQLGFKPGIQQLNVKTTLDYTMQTIGEATVRGNLSTCLAPPSCDPRGLLSSGLVAENPTNGEILVMVGSPDYNAQGGQYNWTTTPRNVGSSVKPYTYAAVINARAATVDTPVYDGPSPFIYKDAYSTTKFYNYDSRSHGVLPLKQALGNSLNICAVKVELSIGVPSVLSYMRNLGLQPRYINPDGSYNTQAPGDEYGPSLTLGGYPITLLEHVGGMATIADMGVYHTPRQ